MENEPRIAVDYLGNVWIKVPNTIVFGKKDLDPAGESWVSNGSYNTAYPTIEELAREVNGVDLYAYHSSAK